MPDVKLQQLLQTADPTRRKGQNYTVRQQLDDFARDLDGRFAADRGIARELHLTVAGAYRNLGRIAEAELHDAVRPDELRQRFAQAVLGEPHLANTLEVLEINGRPAASLIFSSSSLMLSGVARFALPCGIRKLRA